MSGEASAAPAKCLNCGCSELAACPGGCSWVAPGLCSRCVEQDLLLLQPVALEMPLLLVLAVHGNLCLALRHPANTGPSRELIERFVADLEELLVGAGVLTSELAAAARALEAEEQPRVILARD